MRDNRAVIRIRLDLAYRGTNFVGWARQPGLRSVQGVLEDALALLARQPVTANVAGRTDAGVHARGQVVHIDFPRDRWDKLPGRSDRTPERALLDKLNAMVPADVVVQNAVVAPPGFDARYSALYRRYNYRIADSVDYRDPLTGTWVLWSRQALDVDAMSESVVPLLGLRDFAAFCKPRRGASTIRELQEFTWERATQGPDTGLVRATIVADAFCHNMVRAMVGAALDVGLGRKPVQWPAHMLASRSRVNSSVVVAAHGLTLEHVEYPPDDLLASRAHAIRARRLDEEAEPVDCDQNPDQRLSGSEYP
ncbi:tRNA pseudouridine(38-40) synthase TruA [Jonesia quinghaiensis]|uniref:tRNA pseudouridine(38-40) synthase TruA n=1 Tax=Jonesia quinghaiensis TaxID=262806 RepID=UPI0006886D93|nr:tRNA pseudouridine(38-40) synthase TruA [Jonesia quinghaiensis]